MFAPPGACVWGQLCMYVCTGIANSPCSWCAGNMSPPRLPPVDRRHLLPGHLLHGCTVAGAGVPRRASTGTGGRCGRAALCAHGRAMPVTRLRACRLNRADAQSSGEGAARPPLRRQHVPPSPAAGGTVVTCSRPIYSTVAPLQVRACRVVRTRARGAGASVPRCARTDAPCL
jgi:hypothetical protein